MSDLGFDQLVLGRDEFLLLRPKGRMSPERLQAIAESVPSTLRGRIVVVEPNAFDMMVVRKID